MKFWNRPKGPADDADAGGARMRFALLNEVRAYWEGLRSGVALPRRDMVDPRGIAGALSSVFIAERIGTGLASFRLAGMQISEIAGTDVRGLPLSVLLSPAARPRFALALERVFTAPAISEIAVVAERGLGRPALEGRILLLPLLDARGVCDLCLGCFALDGEVGRGPRRFDVSRSVESLLATPDLRPAPQRPVMRELAEGAEPYRPARPALRLVRSRD